MKKRQTESVGGGRGRDSEGVRSVERAGRILEALLAAVPSGLRLAEIAELTELHKSTALRLLRTLCAIGVIRKSSHTDRYRWDAFRWLAVAAKTRGPLLQADAIQRLLDTLATQSGETVAIGYPDITRRQILFIAVSLSRNALRFDPGELRSWPIHASAAGKICLAYSRPEDIASLKSASLQPVAPRTITSVEVLMRELETSRARGYAVSQEEGHPGAFGLAVPILDEEGDVVAALQLAAPMQRRSDRNTARWVELLQTTSREATRLLHLAGVGEARRDSSDARADDTDQRIVDPTEGSKRYRVL